LFCVSCELAQQSEVKFAIGSEPGIGKSQCGERLPHSAKGALHRSRTHWRAAGSQGSCAVLERKKLQKWDGIGDVDKFQVNGQADAEVFPNAQGGVISSASGCVYASGDSLVNKLEMPRVLDRERGVDSS